MRSARPRTVAAFAGCASLALAGAASSAWACTGASALTTISPTVGQPGQPVNVVGTDYAASPVEIRWNGADGAVLGTAMGPNFEVKVTVPAQAAGGMFYITGVQRDAAGAVTYKVADVFEVTAPAQTGAVAPGQEPLTAPNDLWSALEPGRLVPSDDLNASASGTSSASSNNTALGAGLLAVGTATVLGVGALAVPITRRRRALAANRK